MVVVLATAPAAPVLAQENRTADLAQELARLLDAKQLQVVAARENGTDNRFVAARYTQGVLLLVIAATYQSPPLLQEKLHQRKFEEIYLDLNTATDPKTRVFVEDMGANGIKARRAEGETLDIYTSGSKQPFVLDGDWKKHEMREDDYMQVYQEADGTYTRLLESLIAELKKNSS